MCELKKVHLQTFLKIIVYNIFFNLYPLQIEASPREKAVAGLRLFWDEILAAIIDFMWNSHGRSIQLYDREILVCRPPFPPRPINYAYYGA